MKRRWLVATAVLTALFALSLCQDVSPLEWILMGDNSVTLPPGDDASTGITSPIGFAFGGSVHHEIYVMTNGLISFDTPFPTFFNQIFPGGVSTLFLVAPFWDDVNTNIGGTISYEIHTSGDMMEQVSAYIQQQTSADFEGYWMMVVLWDSVPPFSFFGATDDVNTFQVILITDSNQNSYAIFIYECGLMEWDNFATIGYNAGPGHYDNHDPSSSDVACVNYPTYNFSNVFYQLHEAEPLPTEPAQNSYLDFLGHTNTFINSGYLPNCDECISPEITLPGEFPFGNYYHQTAYMASNGHISFRIPYTHFNAELFPTTNPSIYWDFVSAPFWSDVDLRLEGSAYWEIHVMAQSQQLIKSVSTFIRENYDGAGNFSGEWMMISSWEGVHPFPHGAGSTTPYSLSTNTYQAILITNGTKSYAVYTYKCGEMEWGDESTIGFNAGADYHENHPITGHFQSHFIACLQNISNGSLIKNQIYDLVPNPDSLLPGAIPPSHNTIGSCDVAGFTECCSEGDCRGLPLAGSCFCDGLCSSRGDCCYDQQHICPTGLLTDDYLILAEDTSIRHMSLNGTDLETLSSDINGRAYGIDYHFMNGLMIWSDVERNTIYKKNLNGTGLVTALVTTNIAAVDDVAIDWIGNNLYWTDAVWARIEVMNLDTLYRAEILRTGANTNPRAIAVDPTTRFMYWTEVGKNVRIERAYMDGNNRQVLLVGPVLNEPNGITIDIAEQRLYWCDSSTIAYADVGSTGVIGVTLLTIENGVDTIVQPFSLALSGTSVFWTDWSTSSIYSTHKIYGDEVGGGHHFTVYTSSLGATPRGLEVVSSSQQPTDGISNPCDGSGCSHICLSGSSTSDGTCACPENFELDNDGLTCQMVDTPSPTTPPEGSCSVAGYSACCSHGGCAGRPATCFCDAECYQRFDCCSDLQNICNEVAPVPVTDVNVILSKTTASITFTVPFVVYDTEQYKINYGTSADLLLESPTTMSSGNNNNTQYTIQISELLPGTTYYFQISSMNTISTTLSGVISGSTLEDAPSGPPQNFTLAVDSNSLIASWTPPFPEDRNGNITSYTLSCEGGATFELVLNPISQISLYDLSPNTEYTCRIAASTAVGIGPYTDQLSATTTGIDSVLIIFRWLPMGAIYSTTEEFLPPTDDGFEGPIEIPPGFPFGSSVQTQVFVGTNGLISFGTGYNSFSNGQFPGSDATASQYLVAPFWDDVDIRFNTGDISYEIHESGYFLDQVNAFIQQKRLTDFEGTWMIVVFYNAVHPFFGLFSSEENTFQAILITDGTYSYTIFTYQCGLMEWDNGATIGFNAAGEIFANHNPSTADIACLNSPDTDWSNVVFLLSTNTSEPPPPSNVEAVNITLNSTTILWVVTSLSEQQQYTVLYGTDPSALEMSTDPLASVNTMDSDLMFQQNLNNLVQGTTYYVQVVATLGNFNLTSNVISFTTLEPALESAPLDFTAIASGTSLIFTWSGPIANETIVSYHLICNVDVVDIEVKAINILTLYDLAPEFTFFCTLAAASSGGYGPPTDTFNVTTGDAIEADSYFSFIPMDIHVGVDQVFFPESLDGYIGPIAIPGGLPFGDAVQTDVYIGTNGILSFGGPYNPFLNEELPVPDVYLVAPYWDNIDIRFGSGQISYEIHQSGYFLEEVSEFIRRRRSAISFTGTWMLIAYWDAVHPFFGLFTTQENTFQAILITDGMYSYTLFTYNCALTEWDNGVTIGISDGGNLFDTFHPSSSEVACLNLPASNFSNVIYRLSNANPEIPPPEMVTITNITETEALISWNIPYFTAPEVYTVEYGLTSALDRVSSTVQSITDTSINFQPYDVMLQGLNTGTRYYFRVVARFGTDNIYVRSSDLFSFFTQFEPQAAYLPFLEHNSTSISDDVLLSCDDCSSLEISLPSDFPFGGYFHQSIYVSTNGIITFGSPLISSEPEELPPTDSDAFWTYMIAPFWADFDTTMGGTVSWEMHSRQNSPALVATVDSFIAVEFGDQTFEGSWMLVAFWENVQPSELTNGNTFQAILTTNGTKSYAVFTYHCGELQWSDSATIGFNSPPYDAFTHPLSTALTGAHIRTDEIACIHDGSEWSNVILELEDHNHILEMTPEPTFGTGSCAEAGFTECCVGFACLGQPPNCYCDSICRFFGDCCYDIDDTCPSTDGSVYDILVGHGDHISQVHFEGSSSETVRTNSMGTVVGVDYLYSDSLMFWSDITTDTIHRANLDGSGEETLVDSCISTVDDIAVDWVSNKLYWADAVWARIEALDLNSSVRVEVLRTGANSRPRAIAVDPINRAMFWTEYGITAKIETAAMDGSERRTLHFVDISQPNGITIDYNSGRIYWSDAGLDRLEYSGFDGSDRSVVESGISGLLHPFSVTVADNLLFWSDWATNKVYATHYEHGTLEDEGYFAEIVTFIDTPYGIEALRADRQPSADNPCLNSRCSHMCLLTFANEDGFACACPEGYNFENATFCKSEEVSPTLCSITPGSCAGYTSCCEEGFCTGYPATCFCDSDCRMRGDCCSDINDTCTEGWPRLPRAITVTDNNGQTATVSWLIPFIESTRENYTVQYGSSSENLEFTTSVSSGVNTSITDQMYSTTIAGLLYVTTYYFRITVTNDIGAVESDVLSFTTPEGAPNTSPVNFSVSVTNTMVCLSWDPLPENRRNGIIISYTLTCSSSGDSFSQVVKEHVRSFCLDLRLGNQQFSCSVLASTAAGDGPPTDTISVTTEGTGSETLQFLLLNSTFGVDQVFIPESDDGTFGPIPLPDYGFPFWSTSRTQAYVAVNGLLSFDLPYGSFFNEPFPGSSFISSRYLVAPFWDDANIFGGRGQISYEVHDSGYLLDHVSAYIRAQRPSAFQGTWMLIVFYDAVQPYIGSGENTYQAILITDGTYTYTIFIYDCNLAGWGTSATIGFNAGREAFENNEHTSIAIACSSLPLSSITNVIYRLSQANGEYVLPQNIVAHIVQPTSVTVSWVVPSVTQQQQYSVVYGLDPQLLDQTSAIVDGTEDITQTDQAFSVDLSGLITATTYYFRIAVTFGEQTIMSELNSFRTQDESPSGPPVNVLASVIRVSVTFTWEPAPVGTGILLSYTLSCSVEDAEVLRVQLKPVQEFFLEELSPSTTYTCSLFGSTSGGDGPSANFTFNTEDIDVRGFNLPFILMDILLGTEQIIFPESDEAINGPLSLNIGFPFGSSVQTDAYVATNGLLSFGTPYGPFFNQPFPGSSAIFTRYLVAPFWDDVHTSFGSGQISYEIHQSGYYLDRVNKFLKRNRPSTFEGTWMMVVYWDAVHPYFALSNTEENTFQAILITDGTFSYTIFTYKCGLMEWDNGAIIGYNAAGESYANYNPSTSAVALSCLNSPYSNYSNIIYLLSNESPEFLPPEDVLVSDTTINSAMVSWRIPTFETQEQYYILYGTDPDNLNQTTDSITSPLDTSVVNMTYDITLTELLSGTVYYVRVAAVFDEVFERYSETIPFITKEPQQTSFLQFLPRTSSTTLERCDDCTSEEITFPENVPFGGYFHQSAYVSTNGLISFGRSVSSSNPVLFPSTTAIIAQSYIVAPFWADFDTTIGGSVSWWTETSDSISVGAVSNFITQQQQYGDFSGTWMLAASWEDMQPSVAGTTFQAILITDGSKSYAVYTYRCGELMWSDPATIGLNTPTNIRINHPLSGTSIVDDIACIRQDSEWNNLIYELETNPVILPITPAPANSIGSCVAAGFTECCTNFNCLGAPVADCFCDLFCFNFGDCCYDIDMTCQGSGSFDVLVGHGHHISQVHFEGTATETVRTDTTGTVVGVDYFDSESKMFWSDVTTDTIHRANMDGTAEEVLVNTNLIAVDDIAVDWVSGKLYWTDAGWARIEAMDLDSLIRVELIRTGSNTAPRAIAVDPTRRVMYWTDWGRNAKIEVASMDGNERRDFVVTELSQPNGITIDLVSERVYWSDADLDKLEFISYDGSSRTSVETEATGLLHPFAVSVGSDVLFWSDWATNSIYATHKEHGANDGNGYFATIASFPSTPYGVEALHFDRQPSVANPCENNECSHVCLLSLTSPEKFVCACPVGYFLDNTTFCKVSGDTATPTPPADGTCAAADYEYCCDHGYCAGYPATCFCDSDCFQREDCCSDISDVCVEGSPRAPTAVTVLDITQTSARIRWTVPFITSTEETYFVTYGLNASALTLESTRHTSGPNISSVYSQLLSDLDPSDTYYFRVIASNAAGSSGSDIDSFATLNGPPSGPPLDFNAKVDVTSMAFVWSPPESMLQNGDIVSYTLSCTAGSETTSVVTSQLQFTIDLFMPGEIFQCSVYATNIFGDGPPEDLRVTTESVRAGITVYLPLLELGSNRVLIPAADDGPSGAIPLPESGFPFGSTSRSQIYVGTNGLLSFDSPYDSWSNELFPGSVGNRYLVAPFWDDADTRFGNGQVFYEIYETGYQLDYVSAFIRRRNPSNFHGTWMMITFWDAVRPYSAFSNLQENTYQAILITDGTISYTIFTYDCYLLEWGRSTTIGFNAGGEAFENNEYTTNAIACSSLPDSNVTNVIYRLSTANSEYPPPQSVQFSAITLTTVTVSWVVPYTPVWQQYSIVYGVQPDVLNQSWGLIYSPQDTSLTNQSYTMTVQGLTQGTDYYLRVSSTFGYNVIYSELMSFLTLEPAPSGPPLDFNINVTGTTLDLTWQQPAKELRNGLIRSYTLTCSSEGEKPFTYILNSVLGITLDEFRISTNYSCTIFASTSGGGGPSTSASATTDDVEDIYLPLIPVGNISDTGYIQLPESDDDTSDAIDIPPFPFGDSIQTRVFVGTNGLLSFNTSYNFFGNSPFSETSPNYLVAPFWDDVDTRGGNGRIFYEIHKSGYFLDQVNTFLWRRRPSSFEGNWMLVAHWDAVHPYFGETSPEENTFQAVLITDGTYSYTIFTYKCGLMEWDNGATIGYRAAGDSYVNNNPSSSDVACLNSPESKYSNLIFLLSNESSEIPLPDMVSTLTATNTATVMWRIPRFTTQEEYYVQYGTDPTNLDQRTDLIPSVSDISLMNQTYSLVVGGLNSGSVYYLRVVAVFDVLSKRQSEMVTIWTKENEQAYYLEFLGHSSDSGVVEACFDGCNASEIIFPYDFPFGGYYHRTAFVDTNGVITFGQALGDVSPQHFPLTFWSYLVAPLWVNINTTGGGNVSWEIYDSSNHSELLTMVDELIQQEQGDATFSSLWILVASWEDVEFTDQPDIGNTFQAILTTNGTKSYSIFTYNCEEIQWSGPVSVGYSAPPSTYYNHPLTLTSLPIDTLACSHLESVWNNVITDLQPGNVILPTTPQPAIQGSCRAAGFTGCCEDFDVSCIGFPAGSPPCFCDSACIFFADCCFDADHTCNAPTYDLLVGNGDHLSLVHFEGTVSETVRSDTTGNVVGVDIHVNRSLMFWSDTVGHTIHQANLNGEDEQILVNSSIRAVDDIAVDWITNNLYWVDSVWARIEVLNLDNMERAEILRVGANTRPRAIAVDPIKKIMFWTDWGQTAKIERAFMDGEERRTILEAGLSQPNGITIDYLTERIYWSDSDLDKLEYSNYDGNERMVLETQDDGVFHPFALTIVDDILFWTDWETNYLYYTHKDHGNTEGLGLYQPLAHFTSTPYGVEAIADSRQHDGENPCKDSNCSHICLLSGTSNTGYVCACAQGAELQEDEKTCDTSPIIEPTEGSCVEAEYDTCCAHGFCAGYPATCSCNPDCHALGDCCSDIDEVCPAVPPLSPTLVEVTYLTHITAVIEWRVDSIAFSPELYTLMYSTTADDLNTVMTEPQFSGTDITVTGQVYSVRLENLSPGTRYYYQIKVENTVRITLTNISAFSTPFVGPPQNFVIIVEGAETLTFSWELPLETEQEDIDYFVIECKPRFQHDITELVMEDLTVTLEEFLPGTTYTCTVAAKADDLGAPATQTATTEEAPTNLPFLVLGTTVGVEKITLTSSDDANSPPIYITGGLPLGSTTHTIAYVGINGIILFGQEWLFWDPELFPTTNYYIHNSYVTAPFWADVDTRRAGSVFYEVHQRGFNEGSNAILERLSGFISAESNVNFTGSWMLVAQWDRVHPFPHGSVETTVSEQYSNFLESENTFQAAVITDGTQNFVMYTYQCDLMGWSGEGDGMYATIGYNLNGEFHNHPLSGTSQAQTIGCLSQSSDDSISRRQASKWHNELYQLPTAVDPIQQLRSECLTLQILDIQSVGDIRALSSSLGACPNSVNQAILDFRFTYHNQVSTPTSRCYVHVFPAGDNGLSSLICCYSVQSSIVGALLMGGSLGSSMALYHPEHYSDEYATFDTEFRDKCCSSGLCNVFHERRPIDSSINYIPPFFGFVTGDPHITTLDGITYTFNGHGEYTLVKALHTGFSVQGRTQPVSNTSNATQFSAFAMGIREQDLSAEIRLSCGRLVTFINRQDVSSVIEDINSTSIQGNNTFYLRRTGENSVRVLLYKDGIAYVLTVTRREDILDFVINLEDSVRGNTRGLLGNFNGDSTDDFIMPNGIQVPVNASDQMLHDFGQSWQITAEESHFTYPTGMNYSHYFFPDHTAPLLSVVVANAPDDIRNMCSGNEQCIFDAVQTNNPSIGTGTLNSIENNNNDIMQANNFPPRFDGLDTFRVNVGEVSTYTFTVADENGVGVTVQGPPPSVSYSLTPNDDTYTFSWTVVEVIDFSIMFVAVDSMDAVSILSPLIEICACQNNGSCTRDGVLSTDENIIDMQCECTPAWEGRYCENDLDGCSELTCFEGVQCYDVVAPGYGAICGSCPNGHVGDGEKCADFDECNSTTTSNCQQVCINTPGSFMCGCLSGYQMVPGNATSCEDINECELQIYKCQHKCSNTEGSYTCSCRDGYELANDQIGCTAREQCGDGNSCSDDCALVNGNPTCSCPNGLVLDNDGLTCIDVNECLSNIILCEDSCTNTNGSFECGCTKDGYTLSSNKRNCEDVNECIEGVLSGSPACPEREICQNKVGGVDCACPAGTTRNNQECVVIEITRPPVVTVPPERPSTTTVDGKDNSVNVTLRISKEEFDMSAQLKFKLDVVDALIKYCEENTAECGGEALVVTTSDVVLSQISNDANKRATFIMYVYIKEGTALLNRKILQTVVSTLPGVVTVEAVIGGEPEKTSDGGPSGGAVAAIVIVIILAVVVVLITTAIILYRMRRMDSFKFGQMSLQLRNIFRNRQGARLIEETGYDSEATSMKDTASVSGDTAEAKAKEAESERGEPFSEDEKMDIAEAEESV